MAIIAIANQKGGVAKTTTAVNLGAYLAALGSSVLLIDCDPQANATSFLGQPASREGLFAVLVEGAALEPGIVHPGGGLDLLPSSPDLAAADAALLDREQPDRQLATALEEIRGRYEYIFLDCPPSLGLLTLNALVAADAVIVPVQCEYLALEGLARLIGTIDRVRAQANPRLRLFGLVMTMFDSRTALSHQVAEEVRRHYPSLTFETVIPRNVRLSEAPSFGQSILDYDPLSRGGQAYQALAMEVASRTPAQGAGRGAG
jgi:chromosome partitioning protein